MHGCIGDCDECAKWYPDRWFDPATARCRDAGGEGDGQDGGGGGATTNETVTQAAASEDGKKVAPAEEDPRALSPVVFSARHWLPPPQKTPPPALPDGITTRGQYNWWLFRSALAYLASALWAAPSHAVGFVISCASSVAGAGLAVATPSKWTKWVLPYLGLAVAGSVSQVLGRHDEGATFAGRPLLRGNVMHDYWRAGGCQGQVVGKHPEQAKGNRSTTPFPTLRPQQCPVPLPF